MRERVPRRSRASSKTLAWGKANYPTNLKSMRCIEPDSRHQVLDSLKKKKKKYRYFLIECSIRLRSPPPLYLSLFNKVLIPEGINTWTPESRERPTNKSKGGRTLEVNNHRKFPDWFQGWHILVNPPRNSRYSQKAVKDLELLVATGWTLDRRRPFSFNQRVMRVPGLDLWI